MAIIRRPSVERRQQIIEAALGIISSQGVHRLTTLEIAREVGIADGTIFRHFHSKEEIIDAAIDYLERLLFDGLPDLGEEPLTRLKRFFLYRLELVRKNPAVVRLAFTDRLAEVAGEASAAKFRMLVARSRLIVRDCIVAAQQRSEVARDIPVDVLVMAVIGVLRGAAMGGSFVAPMASTEIGAAGDSARSGEGGQVPHTGNPPVEQGKRSLEPRRSAEAPALAGGSTSGKQEALSGEEIWAGVERLLRRSAH